LGLVYGEANQPEMSELQFRQVLSDVPSYRPAIKALGNVLIENGRLTTAEIEAEKLRDNPDCCVDGLLLLARVQESRGDMAAAARTLEDSQQQFPKNPIVLEECCRFHFMNENWPESKQFLTSLIELDNNNAAAWHNLGAVLLRLDESEAAIEALTKSVELRPDSPTTQQLLETALQHLVPSHNVG
jgi:predicted Zn-dependent protease